MKASDLRMKNLITYKGDIATVLGLGLENQTILLEYKKDFEGHEFTYKENIALAWPDDAKKTKPITLTEEWLLKMGFESHDCECENGITWKDFYIGEIGIYHYTGDNVNKFVFEFEGGNFDQEVKLEYVHQLQNLYFALTGQELTIK